LILGINFFDPKGYTRKINWSKVLNYSAREIQIRTPGCPAHYTKIKWTTDILKNFAFWTFVAAVVLINTFISPRNLDNWVGFLRVTGIVSVAAVLYVSCHVGLLYLMQPFFRKNALSFIIRYSGYFLIVLIVVTFVVWMARILELYDVPNFNGVDEKYPVVLIRLVIFEWLFYCFLCRSSKNEVDPRISKPWLWGITHLRYGITSCSGHRTPRVHLHERMRVGGTIPLSRSDANSK